VIKVWKSKSQKMGCCNSGVTEDGKRYNVMGLTEQHELDRMAAHDLANNERILPINTQTTPLLKDVNFETAMDENDEETGDDIDNEEIEKMLNNSEPEDAEFPENLDEPIGSIKFEAASEGDLSSSDSLEDK